MTAAWAPESELVQLTPACAEACRQVATALGYPHRCPHCDAEPMAGAVAGFRSAEALRTHLFNVHGDP